MKLSAPIYQLKRQARVLSRQDAIPLHEALDRIAGREGFNRWSLLVTQYSASAPASKLYPRFKPGDIVLIGARPGQGKTLLSLELAVEAMKAGNQSVFFSLEYTEKECQDRLVDIGVDPTLYTGLFECDCSDRICADYIIKRLESPSRGTLAVVDYLQLLDQRRETPELMIQVRALKAFALERGLVMVFISQIDRSFDPATKPFPDLEDIRLPNPLDLSLFDHTCFLHNGEVQVSKSR
jgi:hypothetical protein